MTNARPNEVGTGAVMAGGHGKRTATNPQDRSSKVLRVQVYRNTGRLFGGRVRPLLELAAVETCMYDRALGCWTVPVHLVDNVLVAAEFLQRRSVTVEEVDS